MNPTVGTSPLVGLLVASPVGSPVEPPVEPPPSSGTSEPHTRLPAASAAQTCSAEAQSAILFYLLAYTVSTIGAFGTLILCGSRGAEAVSYEDLAGFAAK